MVNEVVKIICFTNGCDKRLSFMTYREARSGRVIAGNGRIKH